MTTIQGVARCAMTAALLLFAACGGTTGGTGGVFASNADAAGDGQIAGDATPTAADVAADDAAALSDASGTDAVAAADVQEPSDVQAVDDAVALVDVPVANDSGKAPCKSDVACKATNQVCDLAGGACVDCNSKVDCTGVQVCVAHQCVVQTMCTSSKDCPFVCNKASGICVECVTDVDCDAGKACAADFACHAKALVCIPGTGQCVGAAFHLCLADGTGYDPAGQACADSNACTLDQCSNTTGGCTHTSVSGPCNDGNACTTGEQCLGGVCSSGSPLSCDDKDACTTDACDPAKGCVHAAIANCVTAACGKDPNNTCSGKCGQASGMFNACSCATDCKSKGTCCGDYDACACATSTPPTCGADPTNTCKGKCTTDTQCTSMICQSVPQFCAPDWAACCNVP